VRKTDARKAETHERLLEAARRVFAAGGYERSSVNDVIALAGSSKGAFYHHFDSKEALFLELMDGRLREQYDAVRQTLTSSQSMRLDDLIAAAADAGFNVYRNQDWAPLYMEFWAYATRNAAVRERMAEMYKRWRANLGELVRAAQGQGIVSREINAEKAASLIIAIFEGLQLQLLIEEDALPMRDVARFLVRMFRPTRGERPTLPADSP